MLNFIYGRREQDILPLGTGPQAIILASEGLVSIGRNRFLPHKREENIYQIIDNLALVNGHNQLKFGIDLSYTDLAKLIDPDLSSGLAVLATLDFRAELPQTPVFTTNQAIDPLLRTASQQTFLKFLNTVLPIALKLPANLFPDLTKTPLPSAYV